MPDRPFDEFVTALRQASLDPTPREIAEMLWLASRYIVDYEEEAQAHRSDFAARARPDGRNPRDKPSRGTTEKEQGAGSTGAVVPETAHNGASATRSFRASKFRSPAASALPDPQGLARAIRPLMRRVPSRSEFVLDVEESVRRMADEGLPSLVFRPARTRWLDLVLVADDSPTLAPWRRTLEELRDLLAGYGIFRDVLALTMEASESGEVRLFRGLPSGSRHGRQCGLGEVLAPGDDRLILILSDTMSAGWLRGTIAAVIGRWGRVHPTALVQLLARDLWQRSPLGVPVLRFRYPTPGAPNSQLAEVTVGGVEASAAVALPLVSLDRRSLANWASAFAARRHAAAPGIHLASEPLSESLDSVPEDTAQTGAMERYSTFARFASREARQLMTYLAAVPLTLPVIRLVQRAMLDEPHPAQIAEILLSGLLVVASPGRSEEDTLYEFHADVRDLLRTGLSHPAAIRVLEEVSEYVSRHLNSALDFGALVLTDNGEIEVDLPEEMRPFARLAAETMARYRPSGSRTHSGEFNQARAGAASGAGVMHEASVHRKPADPAEMEPAEAKLLIAPLPVWPPRILWVDDTPSNNRVEIATLRRRGVELTLAQSSEEARAHLKQSEYHVILSDMRRAEGEQAGLNLLRELREKGNLTPFIIFSAHLTMSPEETKALVLLGTTNATSQLYNLIRTAFLGSDGFYSATGIKYLVTESIENNEGEEVREALLVYRIESQRTWFVTTNRRMFCLLDSVKTRANNRVLQWNRPLEAITIVQANRRSNKEPGSGLLDIGRRNPWLYSVDLFPDPLLLETAIREMIAAGQQELPQELPPNTPAPNDARPLEDNDLLPRGEQSVPDPWPPRILWINDHFVSIEADISALRTRGAVVAFASSSNDARAHLDKAAFHMIISDIYRPEGTRAGIDLLRALRQEGDRTPFIIFSERAGGFAAEVIALGAIGATSRRDELHKLIRTAFIGPDGFHTLTGIKYLVAESIEDAESEEVQEAIVIYADPPTADKGHEGRRTWLVTTTRRLYVLSDSKSNRDQNTVIEFYAPLETVLPVRVRTIASVRAEPIALPGFGPSDDLADDTPVGTGILQFASGRQWQYSHSLFPKRESLATAIEELIAHSQRNAAVSAGSRAYASDIQTRVNQIDGAEMILIPAGPFLMGSEEHHSDERPLHTVMLDAYWIYKNPVTVAQFQNFCGTNPVIDGKLWKYDWEGNMPDWGWKDDHPMVSVTWDEANAYCHWAGVMLPTDAEWEKAARGTDGREYPWGNDWDAEKCQCSKTVRGDAKSTARIRSFPAGASPYGVLDIAGNVWEWCADWYSQYYRSLQQENPSGPEKGDGRVLRGGSWIDFDSDVFRCSYRGWGDPTIRDSFSSFRSALRSTPA